MGKPKAIGSYEKWEGAVANLKFCNRPFEFRL